MNKFLTTLLFLLILSPSVTSLADVKISQLPQDFSPTADDYTVTVDAPDSTGVTKKVRLSAVRDLILSGDGSSLTGMTKSQVGLSNVENTALSTWAGSSNLNILKFVHSSVTALPADATQYLDGTGHYSVPSAAAAGGFTDGGTFVYNTTSTDNVGIGTITQSGTAKLTVSGTVAATTFSGNATTATLATSAIAFSANGANCTAPAFPLGVDASGAVESCTTVLRPTDIDTSAELINLLTDETGTGSLVFSIAPKFTGNVGINSTSPGVALDVVGTIRATAFSGLIGGWTHSNTTTYTPSTDNIGIGTSLPSMQLDVGLGHIFGVDSTGLMTINGGATPGLTTFGQFSTDNNAWATSRGAPVFHDGTGTVYLIGALSSDTPSDGQVPTWNSGGTITWETPSAGSGGTSITAADTQVIFSDGANNPVGDNELLYNKTTNTLTTDIVQTTASQFPSIGLAASSTDSDWIIGVSGNGGTDDDALNVGIGTTVPDIASKLVIKRDGNVGIGTNNPPNKFYVAGTAEVQGFKMTSNGLGAGYVLTSTSVGLGTWMPVTAVGSSQWTTTGPNIYYAANVGIGSTVPGNPLDVQGTIRTTAFKLTTSPTNGYVLTSDATGNASWSAAGSGVGTVNSGIINAIATYPATGTTVDDQTGAYVSNGNLGIGTTNPINHFQIVDNSSTSLIRGRIDSTTGTPNWVVSGNTSSKTPAYTLQDNNGGATSTDKGSLVLCRDSSSPVSGCGRNDMALNTPSGSGKRLFVVTEAVGTRGTVIDSTGNVGIGTFDPHVQMEVKGGDFYVNTTSAKIHLREPDGTCCYLSASNAETISCTSEVCP